ncbi:MAG: DUF4168 domain-containing protein [Balneolaceae bacterium]
MKYFNVCILVLALLGCQNDSDPRAPQEQEAMDNPSQQGPRAQMQQPSVDTDVSDEELQAFVQAAMSAQQIQMESQQEMMSIVENEGIDVNTYNQIAEARQMGQSDDEIDVSPEDIQNYESASEQIDEVGQEIEGKMSEAVEDEGMEFERFQEINMAIQQDPGLQQRIQEQMQESMMQGQQQGPPQGQQGPPR